MSAQAPHLVNVARRVLAAFAAVGDLSAPSPTERAGLEAARLELEAAVREAEDAASMASQMGRILGRDARRGIRRRKPRV